MPIPLFTDSIANRKVVWIATVLMAAAAAACGDSPQSTVGTAPSALAFTAPASEDGARFGLLKNDKDKHRGPGNGDAIPPTSPTTDTTPDADDEDGPGHHKTQIEGFATDVTGDCPDKLTIVINVQTVITALETEFQRATCEQIRLIGKGAHLHIAGGKDGDSFIATYVRLQGKKPAKDEDETDED